MPKSDSSATGSTAQHAAGPAPSQPQEVRPRHAHSRFRYSLAGLMIAMTAAAMILGVAALVSETFVRLVLVATLRCVLPTPAVVGAIFGRGDWRAFSIGALVPWLALWTTGPFFLPLPSIVEIISLFLIMVVTALTCGALAVATRRWIERSGPG